MAVPSVAVPTPSNSTLKLIERSQPPVELATLSQVGQSAIDAMSFAELDDFVNQGVNCISLNLVSISNARKAVLPAIQRVHDALSSQGGTE